MRKDDRDQFIDDVGGLGEGVLKEGTEGGWVWVRKLGGGMCWFVAAICVLVAGISVLRARSDAAAEEIEQAKGIAIFFGATGLLFATLAMGIKERQTWALGIILAAVGLAAIPDRLMRPPEQNKPLLRETWFLALAGSGLVFVGRIYRAHDRKGELFQLIGGVLIYLVWLGAAWYAVNNYPMKEVKEPPAKKTDHDR